MDIISPIRIAEPFALVDSPPSASITLTLSGLMVQSISTPTPDTILIAVRPVGPAG